MDLILVNIELLLFIHKSKIKIVQLVVFLLSLIIN